MSDSWYILRIRYLSVSALDVYLYNLTDSKCSPAFASTFNTCVAKNFHNYLNTPKIVRYRKWKILVHPQVIRKRRDYVYGICQYKVVSIRQSYFRVKPFQREGGIIGKTWVMYKTWIKNKKWKFSQLYTNHVCKKIVSVQQLRFPLISRKQLWSPTCILQTIKSNSYVTKCEKVTHSKYTHPASLWWVSYTTGFACLTLPILFM